MDRSFTKETILSLLTELANADPKRKLFGASLHDYRLFPPLSESKIVAFEKQHRLTLPEDYRYFVTKVGDGGAGPYYGRFRFGEHDSGHRFCTWEEGSMVGDFGKPFPHEGPWNLPDSFWKGRPEPDQNTKEEEEDKLWEAWDEKLEEQYYNPSIMNGAIPICHLGCAYRQWLVINGPQKGNVWCDDRADDRGVYPLLHGKKPTSFASWYISWLTDPRKAMGIK